MANDVSYFQIEGNPTTYSFNDADAESRIAQKVSKSGDTMTGGLIVTNNTPVTLQDTAITIGTAPSGTHNGAGVRFSDSAGTVFGYVRPTYRADGNIGVQLVVTRTVGGETKSITLALLVDNSGALTVSTNAPTAWLTGLGAMALANGAYQSGDSVSLSGAQQYAGVWFSTTVLRFLIPLQKVATGLTASLTGSFYVRGDGNESNITIGSAASATAVVVPEGVRVQITFSSAQSVTARTVAAIQPGSLTLTFS